MKSQKLENMTCGSRDVKLELWWIRILLTMDPDFNAEMATQGDPIDVAAFNAVSPKDNLAVTWGSIKVSK